MFKFQVKLFKQSVTNIQDTRLYLAMYTLYIYYNKSKIEFFTPLYKF